MPDTAIPGHCLSHVLLTDAADTSVGKSPPGPGPSATAAALTARHGHSSPVSLPHQQQTVDSSMDGVRHPRSPTGTSSTLAPPAKAAAHQHQQSINYRPLQSSDMIKQLLVTAAIVTSQDPKPSPSEARDSRLNEPAAIHIAHPEFPPGPTITIGPSCRNVPTAPTGAAKPNIAATTGSSGVNQMLPTSSLRLNDHQILHDSYDGAEASPATSSWTNDEVDMLTETKSLCSAAASSDTSRETSHSPPTCCRVNPG